MNEPLSKEFMQNYIDITKNIGSINDRIADRVDHIVQLIYKTLTKKKGTLNWWFPNAEEGECGTLDNVYDDVFAIVVEEYFDELEVFSWDFNYEIPLDYLFMTDDEILESLNKFIEDDIDHKEKLKKKAEKQTQVEEKKKMVIKQINSLDEDKLDEFINKYTL